MTIKIEMVEIPASQDQKISSFKIGKYPITQAQHEAVMGNNPSYFKNNPQNPVEQVSYEDAIAFCQELSQVTGKNYRLPTESEWEYACRAGTTTDYYFGDYFGDDDNRLGDYAWYGGNSEGTTHPVGLKLPNAWGLYDISGNVFEWCQQVILRGCQQVILRGGSWGSDPYYCRSAFRLNIVRCDYRKSGTDGFRIVCDK